MSATSVGARGLKGAPPEKGSFPLDHFKECEEFYKVYMKCLKDNQFDAGLCRESSKRYLQCRMDHNLMSRESISDLGFTGKEKDGVSERKVEEDPGNKKKAEGFVAGSGFATRKRGFF